MNNKDNIKISLVKNWETAPHNLLQLADPSKDQIEKYLKKSRCFELKNNAQVIGVLVLLPNNTHIIEIKNIAILPSMQRKGFGKMLLVFAEKYARKNDYKELKIGTGNSSLHQLALYQKQGFEVDIIDKNFFVINYPKPIYENGIQCKHMIYLKKKIQ